MDKYAYEIMKKLDLVMKETDNAAWFFKKTLEEDLSGHRKLFLHSLTKLLIGMEGNSLLHEILNCLHFSREIKCVYWEKGEIAFRIYNDAYPPMF